LACEAIPDHLLEMVQAGGVVPHLERRLRDGSGAGIRRREP